MAINLYHKNDYLRQNNDISKKDNFSPFRRDYARVVHSSSFRRLQAKTQIFPSFENDFFRNRLTHSLEVAQIAKSIAVKLNAEHGLNLDYDLIETAALCHDIGHPPFGHNGEVALNKKMHNFGGFESNAQTLRLISHTAKKDIDQKQTFGLNLTYRTLAATIKYDQHIPPISDLGKLTKGYYHEESGLVEDIKQKLLEPYGRATIENFKTIECYIMDVADDIAYSTYDVEDALKGGFIDPLSMASIDNKLLDKIYYAMPSDLEITKDEIQKILKDIFSDYIDFNADSTEIYKISKNIANNSLLRTKLTSKLVDSCIQNIELDLNLEVPIISKVYLNNNIRKQVEVLKKYILFKIIKSPKLNILRYRGREIISEIFDILISSTPDESLLPDDIGAIFYNTQNIHEKARIISDYISSMTDRYIIELYNQFKSDPSAMIFKPFS
ncbi:dNTP triphosphohydrolase [Francisella philomiragia]|uniref:dGTP triphosphohydrolase n=1 Tax=Francisella philomiragia subsp. philomiragia (strain ATCC 25017 / CCUG 19701 / FSC 153 / O\|nr:dNTP triphosphohydrolase [Francisella philomiragia]AJI47683.1 dGTPase family protein [Francisella philomiragia]AJI48971.1 dGTPase family protein [Francisella philomiragia]MBK2020061.1 dNTP triphosphohydrolase [Francisella philomiragia]MBK2029628.1 dNTP triphosphohydrolase [Francisella philomiragia]MBK2263319.1 dNTP triphosphohydrolase [Francisella philomiragia]